MVDYLKNTGAGGQMMIRDHGHAVEYFIRSGSGNTFANQMPFNWVVDGAAGSSTIRYDSGANWKLVMSFAISASQNVKFGLGNTGTSGLGGPTDFWQYLGRSTTPPAPTPVAFSSVSGTQVYTTFGGQGDGGSPITGWELGWSTGNNYPIWSIWSNGGAWVGGLAPGTVYYFWARGHNAHGGGNWSPVSSVRTANVPGTTTPVAQHSVDQTTMTTTFGGGTDGGMPVLEWQLAYGTNPNGGEFHVSSWGTNYLTGLLPATTYYFWARGRNEVGWGAWSSRTSVRTVAGARIRVSGVWKEAVPYVRVAGVWRVARPHVKVVDLWKVSG